MKIKVPRFTFYQTRLHADLSSFIQLSITVFLYYDVLLFLYLDVLHGIADEFRKASLAVNLKPKINESKLSK